MSPFTVYSEKVSVKNIKLISDYTKSNEINNDQNIAIFVCHFNLSHKALISQTVNRTKHKLMSTNMHYCCFILFHGNN